MNIQFPSRLIHISLVFLLTFFLTGSTFVPNPLRAQSKEQKKKDTEKEKQKKEEKKESEETSFVKDARAQEAIQRARKEIAAASSLEERVDAIRRLEEFPHPETANFLIRILGRFGHEETRIAALETITETGDFRHGPKLADLFSDFREEESRVYKKLIRATGKMGSLRVYEPLKSVVRSPSKGFFGASAAGVRAIKDLDDKRGVEFLMNQYVRYENKKEASESTMNPRGTYTDGHEKVHNAIKEALESLTGQEIKGKTEFRQWFNENRDEVEETIEAQQKKEEERWKALRRNRD